MRNFFKTEFIRNQLIKTYLKLKQGRQKSRQKNNKTI